MILVCRLLDHKETKLKFPYESNHKYINGIEFKLCSDCDEWIPMITHFYANKSSPDGYNPYCKECTKKRSYGWQVNNRKRRSNVQMKYAKTQRGKEVTINAQRKWREKGNLTQWQHDNKDKLQEYAEKRIKKTHKITKNEWENCKNYFNYRCAYCGLKVEDHLVRYKGKFFIGDFHRDHVDDSGANDLSNCVPSCKACNSSKGELMLEEWYNKNNENYSEERLNKINNWLNEEYKKYIIHKYK